MNNIVLEVISKTKNNVVHLKVKGDGDDLGMLYLSDHQFNFIVTLLRAGCFSKDVDLTVMDPYNEDDSEFE